MNTLIVGTERELLLQASTGLGVMWLIAVLASVLVFIAMAVDFVAGWRKAAERGEEHNSHKASRSITKFLLYEGAMLICICADTLIHFVWGMFTQTVYYAPLACCFVGLILCGVEIWSIRERADKKTRHRLDQSARAIAAALDKDTLTDVIVTAIKRERHEHTSSPS